MERTDEALTAESPAYFFGKDDPILQELWQIKARINEEAKHSIETRIAQVRALDWDAARRRVGL